MEDISLKHDPVSLLQLRHARADVFDDARPIGPEDVWECVWGGGI